MGWLAAHTATFHTYSPKGDFFKKTAGDGSRDDEKMGNEAHEHASSSALSLPM